MCTCLHTQRRARTLYTQVGAGRNCKRCWLRTDLVPLPSALCFLAHPSILRLRSLRLPRAWGRVSPGAQLGWPLLQPGGEAESCGAEVGVQQSSKRSASQLQNEVCAPRPACGQCPSVTLKVPSFFRCHLPSLTWAAGRENGCLWINETRMKRANPLPGALWDGNHASP